MGSRSVPGSQRPRFQRPGTLSGRAGALEGRRALAARGGSPGPPQPERARVRQDSQGDALLPQLHENEHP